MLEETHIEVGNAVRSSPTGYAAGAAATAEALASLRAHRPSAIIVFGAVSQDLAEVARGVRSSAPGVPILGASSAGEIMDGSHDESVVVAALASPHLSVEIGVGEGVSAGWEAALDQALSTPGLRPFFDGSANAWLRLTQQGKSAFAVLFSPGSTRRADSKGHELLEAVKRRSLGRLPIFASSAADASRERVFVLSDEGAHPDGVLVALFQTQLRFGIALAHGFRVTETRLFVTAARENEVLELDGRPAADAYAEAVGMARVALEGTHVATASRQLFGTADPSGFVTPNVATLFTPGGGIRFGRPMAPGTALVLLRADPETTPGAAHDAVHKAILRAGTARPALALTSYCALRPKLLGEGARTEIPRAVAGLGGTPLVGMCSYGEGGPSDDGVSQHTNAVISALVIGRELSQTAHVARENETLRRQADGLRARTQAELERLVQERTAQLEEANGTLKAEIAERVRAEQALQRQQRALRTLSACNEALVRATEEQALLDAVCHIVVEVGGYWMSWVGLAEHDVRKTVRPVAQAGHVDGYLAAVEVVWSDTELGRGPVGTAIRSGTPAVTRSPACDHAFAPWREEATRRGYAALAALPLIAQGETLGALAICSAEEDAFDEDDMRLLVELANDLSFGIMALRGREERIRMTGQLVQADRLVAMGTLAAGVAHEINNPLAYVISGLDFLAAGAEAASGERADEVRGVLGEMRDGLTRIRQAVRDLKTFSCGDDEARRPVDLRRVLDPSIDIAFNEIRHRARLVKEYLPTPRVHANESRLGQVFLNLLINAAHAIPEGAADRNEIRVRTSTDALGRAVVEIRDTGDGIPPEHLERIFEPFFTTKPVGTGTGLGLSICRNLVVALGGTITADSAPGRGSTFRITLPPLPALPEAVPEADGEVAGASAAPPRRARVLVVDDEPNVARAVRRTLARHHEVVVETDPRAALRRIAGGERFDLVISDLMMPDMSGMELHAELATRGLGQRILFLTGGAFTPQARAFLATVPNPRLEKPFDGAALRALVAKLVA